TRPACCTTRGVPPYPFTFPVTFFFHSWLRNTTSLFTNPLKAAPALGCVGEDLVFTMAFTLHQPARSDRSQQSRRVERPPVALGRQEEARLLATRRVDRCPLVAHAHAEHALLQLCTMPPPEPADRLPCVGHLRLRVVPSAGPRPQLIEDLHHGQPLHGPHAAHAALPVVLRDQPLLDRG